jgi:hypothetical protein
VIYGRPGSASPITQGDILDGCRVFGLDAEPGGTGALLPEEWRVRAIVLTQACDLAQERASRILIAVVHNAADLVEAGVLKDAAIRDHIRRGRMYGWYFLPACAELGLQESVVDLRDLHTVPRPVLTRLAAEGQRAARLLTPYREHLAQHFAVTYSRIGLPDIYETEPEGG